MGFEQPAGWQIAMLNTRRPSYTDIASMALLPRNPAQLTHSVCRLESGDDKRRRRILTRSVHVEWPSASTGFSHMFFADSDRIDRWATVNSSSGLIARATRSLWPHFNFNLDVGQSLQPSPQFRWTHHSERTYTYVQVAGRPFPFFNRMLSFERIQYTMPSGEEEDKSAPTQSYWESFRRV